MNLYRQLNVAASASMDEIKRAYRQRAKETHPDAGGSPEEFEKVTRANIVLSDPAKRKKYDETGEIDSNDPDNPLSGAISVIVTFFDTLVQQHVAGSGGDPAQHDLVALCKQHINQTLDKLRTEKTKFDKHRAGLEKVEKRLIAKGAKEIVKMALRAQVSAVLTRMRPLDIQIKAHEDALAMLDDYSFDAEAAPPQQPSYASQQWGGWRAGGSL